MFVEVVQGLLPGRLYGERCQASGHHGGTNDLVDRDPKTKAVEKIIPQMESLARKYLKAGIQAASIQISSK